jgi:hypothetical protein
MPRHGIGDVEPLTFVLFNTYYWGAQIKENKMCRVRSMKGVIRTTDEISVQKPKWKTLLGHRWKDNTKRGLKVKV